MPRPIDFWGKVRKTDTCWIWEGGLDHDLGYGYAYLHGKRIYAHRAAYILTHGEIGRRDFVEQTCGNKLCVNPDHLHIGTVEFRIWKFVEKSESGCWLWTGNKDANGYGRIFVPGKHPQLAHRVMYELERGEIPDGLFVLHNCPDGDNPSCVNPDHMFLGTQTENLEDMWRKNRQRKDFTNTPRGEKQHKAKLTNNLVRAIRRKKQENPSLSYVALAKEFEIDPTTAADIIAKRTWKHVEDDPRPPHAATYGHRKR